MFSTRLLVALVASVFAAGAAAAVLALSAAAAGGGSVRTAHAPGSGLRVVSAIDVGGAPSSLVVAAGAVWVSLGMDGIARIDPATNEVVARIRPGGAVIKVAAGFGAIWALDLFGDRLLRIDPQTNLVTRASSVGGLPTGIAIGHGSVWVANQLDTTVSRISPDTGRTLATTELGRGDIWPGGIASTRDGVWVVTGGGNEVSRIDPRTANVDLRLPIPGARSLAVARGSLWIGRADATSLVRIDRAGIIEVAAGRRADRYGPALAGGAALWLAVPGSLARLRPLSGSELELRLPGRHHVSAIAVEGDVWVADQSAELVLRVGVAPPGTKPAPAPGDPWTRSSAATSALLHG